MNKMRKLVNKIQNFSLKKKIIIFFTLFLLSSTWIVFRNPVYIDTTAYVFPMEDIGDGRVYWGIKNGYNNLLSDEIPQDAYYQHIGIYASSVITVEDKDNSSVSESISLKNGINFYYLKGDTVRFERIEGIEEILELPKKEGIRLLTVQNGSEAELYFSSIQVWYQKQLLNRAVAATFPFYLAYTTPGQIAFDKSVPDENLYDVSYERRQWFADSYLDPALPHWIAKNFKRSIDFPFGHSRLLAWMSLFAAIVLTCFLFFVPYHLLKIFVKEGTNRLVFIGIGIYLLIVWLVFRHSIYYENDGGVFAVINLHYSPFFTHLYMISEYTFYLTGYSSRVFFMIFQLCIIIWNYEKILSKYLLSYMAKTFKYLFLAIPLLAPYIVLLTVNSRRDTTALLWIIMACIMFIRFFYFKEKRMFILSGLFLLIGIAYRIDYVIFSVPYLFAFWTRKKTVKNTAATGILSIGLLVYALFVGSGSNGDNFRVLGNSIYQVDYALAKHRTELSNEDKNIISSIYEGGTNAFLNHLSLSDSTYSYKINYPLTKENMKNINHLVIETIINYPKEYIKKIVYKYRGIVESNSIWLANHPFLPAHNSSTHVVDLPHKHAIYKIVNQYALQFHSEIWNFVTAKISLLTLLAISMLFFKRMKILALMNATFLLYTIFIALYAPAAYSMYVFIIYYYLYFLAGFIICEITRSGSISKKWVLPANILIVLLLFAFGYRSLGFEYQGSNWNDNKSEYESGATAYFPYYYRVFPKHIMLSASGTASLEMLNYTLELTNRKGDVSFQTGSYEPINKNILETVKIPASTWRAKITFESTEQNVLIDVRPLLDIRKHIYTVLLFLFLYVNISFLRRKLFVVNVRWLSTKDNHTGMYYLSKKIAKKYPYFAQVIVVPQVPDFWKKNELYNIINRLILYYIRLVAGKDDTVFLMECFFFDDMFDQSYLSLQLQNRVKLVALAHLVPARIEQGFTNEAIIRNTSCLDKLLVFGNSLRDYYLRKGVSEEKVISTYHYVDNEYYRIKKRDIKRDGPLTVIVMGNIERNFDQLFEIVRETPDIRYKICRGLNSSLDERCANFPNVKLYKQMQEKYLRLLMHESDVSLNVMNDVVGSNVISTSLACGLAMVCSDVGSIRDYVDPESGILFSNTFEAIEGLRMLNNDRNFLHSLQLKSLKKAETIDIELWTDWFCKLLLDLKGIKR